MRIDGCTENAHRKIPTRYHDGSGFVICPRLRNGTVVLTASVVATRSYLIVADETGIESTTGRQCVRVIARSVRLSNRAMPSHQAEMCREKVAEAKRSAARAPHPSIKILFGEVASSWLRLAEQTEWIERRASEE